MNKQVTVSENQLRKIVKECIGKMSQNRLNEEKGEFNIRVGSGGGYYGGAPIFQYDGETYEFHPSGWDFETNSQMEAAAIMSSSKRDFWNDKQLYEIPINDNLSEYDLECGAYWMTGGNVMWRFGGDENLTVGWDEAHEQVTDACRDHLMECWNTSSNFHELIENLVAKKEDFMWDLYEDCTDLFDYEEDEEGNNENEGDNEELMENRKLRSIIKECVKKALNENEAGFNFKEGDKVVLHHPKRGDLNGIISDYDFSPTTFEPQYDIELEDGKTMICIPEKYIELVEPSSEDEYKGRMENNKFMHHIANLEECK